MPDRELIHSTQDVAAALLFAIDSGFEVMEDGPTSMQRPRIVTRVEAEKRVKGQFHIYKKNWIYGAFQYLAISGGHNKGKFVIKPRTNFAAIFASFHGEWRDNNKIRFGGSIISLHKEWLEMPANELRPYPLEARDWFKRLTTHLSSGVVIKAGVHKYHIAKGVLDDIEYRDKNPPFDFIPWPPVID